jgi:RNAse (barnase) inhibitor barstar
VSPQTNTTMTKPANTPKKNLTINGNNFSDLAGFYAELENTFIKNNDIKFGRNLLALNDLLVGGFGVTAYNEPFTLIWTNSLKSQTDLDFPASIKFVSDKSVSPQPETTTPHKTETLFNILVGIIQKHKHIELVLA